jgi:dihydrolipoamide dehydrogenase
MAGRVRVDGRPVDKPGTGVAAEAALAVEMGATAEDLALTIAPHPTLSEALAEAAMGALGRPLHVRRRKDLRS